MGKLIKKWSLINDIRRLVQMELELFLVSNTIEDNLFLKQFKAVEQMKKEDKNVVAKLMDAFILKSNLQLQLS